MTKFLEAEQPIALADIEEIESLSGLILPAEYKEHLVRFNGGRCKPNVFYYDEYEGMATSSVHRFYAVNSLGGYDLKESVLRYKIHEKKIPEYMFPIACDPRSNVICISCGEGDYGSVYLWDHELELKYEEDDDDEEYFDLYFIADSFEEFIDGLVTSKEADKYFGD